MTAEEEGLFNNTNGGGPAMTSNEALENLGNNDDED